MASPFKNILSNIGANSFAQAVAIAIQLCSVPLYLGHWSAKVYGEWLVISAVPVYLAMLDFGLLSASTNRICSLVATNKPREAALLFSTVFTSLLILVCMLAILSATALAILSAELLQLDYWKTTLLVLIFYTLLSIVSNTLDPIYRASGYYSQYIYLSNLVRLVEWTISMLALTIFSTPLAVASGLLIGRTLGFATLYLYTSRRFPVYSYRLSLAAHYMLPSMFKPALGFLVVPAGNAISIQGFTLVAAALFGPAGAAVFNTYRTISRSTVQLTSILSHALWPELTTAFAIGNQTIIDKLVTFGMIANGFISIVACLVLWNLFPSILEHWTNNVINYDPSLTLLFLAATAVGAIAHTHRVLLMATNRHLGFSVINMILATVTIASAYWLSGESGLLGLAVAYLVGEIATFLAGLIFAYYFRYISSIRRK
jgi:O-antigen/teichoic acid export membrane protein